METTSKPTRSIEAKRAMFPESKCKSMIAQLSASIETQNTEQRALFAEVHNGTLTVDDAVSKTGDIGKIINDLRAKLEKWQNRYKRLYGNKARKDKALVCGATVLDAIMRRVRNGGDLSDLQGMRLVLSFPVNETTQNVSDAEVKVMAIRTEKSDD